MARPAGPSPAPMVVDEVVDDLIIKYCTFVELMMAIRYKQA